MPMSAGPPLACSLSAAELAERRTELAELADAALLEIRHTATNAEVVFAAAPTVRERLEQVIAREAICCPFLTMRVSERPGTFVLEVHAPDGAQEVVSALVGTLRAGAPAVG
jgi:hypothetical protein